MADTPHPLPYSLPLQHPLPDGKEWRLVTKLPLLVIDDEADNASVDTGEQLFNEDGTPDEEHSPKTINSLIRRVLHSFSRKAYVGYTATPFANIYIHHKGATIAEGPDLFPKAFIINLAAPSNYVGPARMFGKLTKEGRVGALPLSRNILDHYDPEAEAGWMPPKHKKTHVPVHNGQETIPQSLREAIHSFVLACAVRELRGQGLEHSSMLIHVTRYVSVQDHVREQVEEAVRRMRQKITRGNDADELLAQMRKLWDEDFVPARDKVAELSTPEELPAPMPSWDDVLAKLPDVLDDIDVRSINGTAKDALDYATPGAALKVIAVGGDKLARGLTLEGLCTSYFVRTTKMYDTLMQMGRWFGYRPGYLDLCRLYTSPDLVKWFGHIADASEELREEFDFMAKAKLTPEQYGLKVMSHETLTVTSPLKMRNAQTLSLTYSGTRPQTILFHRNAAIQQANLDATGALVAALGTTFVDAPKYPRDGEADSWPGARLWQDVDASHVLAFLAAYATHPNATTAKAAVLSDFIAKMLDIGKLKKWSVALLSGGDGVGDPYTFPNGFETKSLQTRKIDEAPGAKDPGVFAIGVLTEPGVEPRGRGGPHWRARAAAGHHRSGRCSRHGHRVVGGAARRRPGLRDRRGRLGGQGHAVGDGIPRPDRLARAARRLHAPTPLRGRRAAAPIGEWTELARDRRGHAAGDQGRRRGRAAAVRAPARGRLHRLPCRPLSKEVRAGWHARRGGRRQLPPHDRGLGACRHHEGHV